MPLERSNWGVALIVTCWGRRFPPAGLAVDLGQALRDVAPLGLRTAPPILESGQAGGAGSKKHGAGPMKVAAGPFLLGCWIMIHILWVDQILHHLKIPGMMIPW